MSQQGERQRECERSRERVLVLTPTGRDATMVEAQLVSAGFACEVCQDLDALLLALRHDAGAALIAQEALSSGQAATLLEALERQAPWSDLPVLLLTQALSARDTHAHPSVGLLAKANVTLLQRPMPLQLLVSAVHSAVRARRRQYAMRDLHQELERAVQLSDMFVGILGHDLRTPLGAIKMSAALLGRNTDEARALGLSGRILRSVDRMTRMIEQLLDLARVRQGHGIHLDIVSADLGGIVHQVVQELGDAHPEARLDVFPSGDLGGHWDPDRLAQVVSNVVGNAVQHGTKRAPVIVELDGTQRATVRLSVGNAGAISESAVPTLFEPFKRAASANPGARGLGLGLFIAREITRAHGGEITVRTADGRTVIEAMLPRKAEPVDTNALTAS